MGFISFYHHDFIPFLSHLTVVFVGQNHHYCKTDWCVSRQEWGESWSTMDMIIPATPSNPSSVSVRETHQFIVRSFGHRCPSENPHGIFPIPTNYMFFEWRDAETQKTPCWPRIQLRLFSIRGIPVNSRAIVSDGFFFFSPPVGWRKTPSENPPSEQRHQKMTSIEIGLNLPFSVFFFCLGITFFRGW